MRTERVIVAPPPADLPRTFGALRERLGLGRDPVGRFVELDGKEYWLKFNWKSHPFRLKTLVQVTGPWRTPERLVEYRNLERLRAAGLLAPRPSVFAEERRFGVMTAHLLLIERIPGAVDLQALLAGGGVPPDRLVELLWAAGDTVGRMHAAGFIHRDLFTRNLLVTGVPGRDARIWLIDCRKGTWSRWGLYREDYDLGCFDVWAATCLRTDARTAFFAAYAHAARPRSLERLLEATERNRRALCLRFARKRAAHKIVEPALDAPAIDPAAVRRFELPAPGAVAPVSP